MNVSQPTNKIALDKFPISVQKRLQASLVYVGKN